MTTRPGVDARFMRGLVVLLGLALAALAGVIGCTSLLGDYSVGGNGDAGSDSSVAACEGGACAMGECPSGWADCNNDSSDGCETHVAIDPANCGKCGAACSASTPNCGGGTCSSIACTPPKTDCNNTPGDGCEVDTGTDVGNCGSCGHACGAEHGTPPQCANDHCVFSCTPPFKHCPTSLDADGCNIDTSSDGANCGDCGIVCGAGRRCVGGSCTCDMTSCPAGCCAGNACSAHALTTCGSAGAACMDCSAHLLNTNGATCSAAGTCDYSSCTTGYLDADGNRTNGCESVSPTAVTEAGSLLLWLVGDDFTPSTGVWADHRGTGSANTCSGASCPGVVAGPKGHSVATFAGAQSITLGANYLSWPGVTIITVWNPGGSNPDYAPLISFGSTAYAAKARVQINQGSQGAWVFQICDLQGNCPYVASGNWTSGWHRTTAIDASGSASAFDNGAPQATGAVALPPSIDRTSSYLGADLFSRHYYGQVAEVLVFNAGISTISRTQIEQYLQNKYGF